MPKQKLTRDMVVEAAFAIARDEGMENVLVKRLAEKLNCSTQPIYSYAKNMDELRLTVEQEALKFIDRFVRQRIDPDDLFRSIGRAHIALCQEEPHLFKIFILQSRSGIQHLKELSGEENGVDLYIARQLGISTENARELHLNMLIFTTGLGLIYTSTGGKIPMDEILKRQDMAYEAFLQQAKPERRR